MGVLGAVYSDRGGIMILFAKARFGDSSLGVMVGSFESNMPKGSNDLVLVTLNAFLLLALPRLSKLGSRNLPWKNYEFELSSSVRSWFKFPVLSL